MRAVQEGTKVFIEYGNGMEQFYDHARDPGEIWNIISDRVARYDVDRLRAAVHGLDSGLCLAARYPQAAPKR